MDSVLEPAKEHLNCQTGRQNQQKGNNLDFKYLHFDFVNM